MRAVLLLSALAILAACDNGNSSTGPNANRPSPSAPSSDAKDAFPSGPYAGGKPQSAFTTITTVTSVSAILAGVGNGTWPSHGTLAKTCPAGTQVIGGGFTMTGGAVNDLHVEASVPDGANGWKATLTNVGPSGSTAYFTVTAICIG